MTKEGIRDVFRVSFFVVRELHLKNIPINLVFYSNYTTFADDMDKTRMNDTLRRNVALLSKQTEQEVGMMPATVAPLPSVEQVKQIVLPRLLQ